MDKEAEVAEILLEFPRLIHESEQFFNSRSRLAWGVRKRRSPMSLKAESPSSLRFSSLPTPPPSSAAVTAPCEPEKPKALSPSTPLLFSPSESDDKSKVSRRKVSLERKREESLQMIDKLTENKKFLLEQIKNVRRLYDQQIELNSKLKSIMMSGGGVTVGSNSNQETTHLIHSTSSNLTTMEDPGPIQFKVHNPFIIDQNRQNSQTAHNNQSPLVSFMVNDNMGPLGIPDLNVSLEASFELETEQQQIHQQQQQQNHHHHHLHQQQYPTMEIKALAAAQARQRRLQICRSKKP